jgi:uncharacterized protein YdaL
MKHPEKCKHKKLKKFFAAQILILILSTFLHSKNVLIVYDGEKDKSEAFISACFVNNLLGHFSINNKKLIHVSEYFQNITVDKDYLFLIFEGDNLPVSDSFMREISNFQGKIVWINSYVEKLLELASDKWGISFVCPENRSDWKIFYKGQEFSKEDPWLNIVEIKDKVLVKVYSWISDSQGRQFPYILQSKNLWYIADSPFSYAVEGGRFLILADLLHNILDAYHPLDRKALLRIEDVSPEDDPSYLRKIANYLHREKIPFQIALIPIFRNPETQYEVRLTERPEMIESLKHAVSKGGTIILHGITHQSRGISAEDFEFWDDIQRKPISDESIDWINQRLETGISECVKNGIFPLSWETPHYSASQNDYKAIAKYFTTFYDRVMAAEISGTQQIFPYPVKLKTLGVTVIPENLGYIDFQNPDPNLIIQNSKRSLVVRDGVASFFFHSFVPIKHLKKAVKQMKKIGWKFISIRDYDCNLKTDSVWVTSSGGEGKVRLDNHHLYEKLIDKKGKIKREDLSKDKHTGIVKKTINLPAGSLYALAAIDQFPEIERKNIFHSTKEKIDDFFSNRKKEIIHIPKVLMIMAPASSKEDENDQKSFQSVFKVFGFSIETIEKEEILGLHLSKYDLLIIPNVSAKILQEAEITTVINYVKRGGTLITDGESFLSEKIGISFDKTPVKVSEIQELSLPAQVIHWEPPVSFKPFFASESLILSKDAWRDLPLAVIIPIQNGKVLFLGTLFDPISEYGISRYPYFPYYLKNFLNIAFNVRRNNLEFYFDPGLRQNTSWEKLVKRWRESGVKIVYLATWHFYKNYSFDYRYFLDLCHNHGIAVYAWFEFPQVTPLFWDNHPQWREKTATGKDAKCHWRYLMNLYNPDALAAINNFFWEIMIEYDWDGVNLAELNYDTNKGAQDPDKFTPMNEDVRKEFKRKEKFDPINFFNPSSKFYWKENAAGFEKFLNFRTRMIRDFHSFFLSEIEKIMKTKGKDMEVIITVMDSLLHPETVEESGIDSLDIVSLMDEFPFTLQVEDPSRSWVDSPTRYLKYFNEYKKHVDDPKRLMFDVNIISRRDISSKPLPSMITTGTELATTVYHAALPSGRVAIYSEYTIYPFDMDILPYVMGADVTLQKKKNGFFAEAKSPFTVMTSDSDYIPIVNGEKWPFYGDSGISLFSGSNLFSFEKVRILDFHRLSTRIIIDADIKDYKTMKNAYSMKYHSSLPVSLTFSRPLHRIRINSKKMNLSSNSLGTILPSGEHEIELLLKSQSFQMIDSVGYLSSSIFYFFGVFSVFSLVLIYFYTRIKR